MEPFEFHPELFEMRSMVLETLAAEGFAWLSDFGSVDLAHDIYGLEVTGIHEEQQATQILELLRRMFPTWLFHCHYFEDQNRRELGWKVIISRGHNGAELDGRSGRKSSSDFSKLDSVRRMLHLTERLIDETSKQLHDPELPEAARAELEMSLAKLRAMRTKVQKQMRELE